MRHAALISVKACARRHDNLSLWGRPETPPGSSRRIARAWAGCHCVATNSAAAMNFFIGFFLFLDRAASFHITGAKKPHGNAQRRHLRLQTNVVRTVKRCNTSNGKQYEIRRLLHWLHRLHRLPTLSNLLPFFSRGYLPLSIPLTSPLARPPFANFLDIS